MFDYKEFYRNKRIMITGGLGFIGSTIAHRLVNLNIGTRILIVDSLAESYGGNMFNIKGIENKVKVNYCDIGDIHTMKILIKEADCIFNMAGSPSHVDAMENPFLDLEINVKDQISLLEACKEVNRNVKILFAGTRGQYGKAQYIPVDEKHPTIYPADPNGINNNAGEQYHLLYNKLYGIRAVSLRLTNTYGPRHLMKHSKHGFLNWFIRLALDNKEITPYEPTFIRDFNYIDDVVESMLMVMASNKTNGEVYNLGAREDSVMTVRDVAKLVVKSAKSGSVKTIPYPEQRLKIEPGDYIGDYRKIKGTVGWEPKIGLIEGLKRTIDFYRKYKKYYWK